TLMMKNFRPIVALVCLSGTYISSLAQNTNPGFVIGQDTLNRNITTAVPFLSITPDSRAAGMGDAGVATSPDANSAYWNAAKLAFIDKGKGLSLSYNPWLAKIINDMKIVYVSGFLKINREETIGASLKYFDLGKIDFRDQNANPLTAGPSNPREFAVDFTYSRLLTDYFSIGGSLRYINSNLTGSASIPGFDAQVGQSVAVDVGVFYTKQLESKNASLSWGASISNIGAKVSYIGSQNANFIPTNLRIGGAYKTELDAMNSLTFALDFNKLMVPSPGPGSSQKSLISGVFGSFGDARGGFSEELREVTVSAGVEYWYNNAFAGRLGYFFEAQDKGNRKYLTIGLGAKLNDFGFDAAYLVPTNGSESALAETLRFTLFYVLPTKAKEDDSVTD
ncbi:MAG: type IX secretion system outer membrane channel protein PorV, partial [Flammeovirgaceae bacterium]